MKINGYNQAHFNPYKQQMQQHTEIPKNTNRTDQIEISSEAKQLQENEKANESRLAHVQEIKQAVQSGNYKIDAEKTAEKMIDFFSGKNS